MKTILRSVCFPLKFPPLAGFWFWHGRLRHGWLMAALFVLLCGTAGIVSMPGASMELWPAERRPNNTLFAYGNDWNAMRFHLWGADFCRHKMDAPERFENETLLTVSLPEAVRVLAVDIHGQPIRSEGLSAETVEGEDGVRQRLRIALDPVHLNERIIKNTWDHPVYIWYEAPAELEDWVSWELSYDGGRLASGSSKLITAGVVETGGKLPERFGFYPYGTYASVPGNNYDRMADFYARFGIRGIESHWHYGLPDSPSRDLYHPMFEANRKHGVKNIANMSLFGVKYAGGDGYPLYGARQQEVMPQGGLAPVMDELVASLESDEAREEWRAAHGFFDMAFWDWEPNGPSDWPGYDDEATMQAFAEAEGIEAPLDAERVQREFRTEYARFRMAQIARPLYALKNTVEAVQSVPFRVESGSGSRTHIDYDIYANDFDAVTPMIYQGTPIGYARDLLAMLGKTPVSPKKFWPDMTIGWPQTIPHRNTPDEFLMDTMVTAAAGCGSVSHWPGIFMSDASWFGIHDGLTRIALVEDFYFDGEPSERATVRGLPYREERVQVGSRTLEMLTPDWRNALISFQHRLGEETLFTLLNYHAEHDAYVEINDPELAGAFLVNPVDRTYLEMDSSGAALVRVGAVSPALWVATRDAAETEGKTRLDSAVILSDFARAQSGFEAAGEAGEIAIGTVGAIETAYAEVDFAGEQRLAFAVKTPLQTVGFGASGGRIFTWVVEGMPDFVAGESFATDGFTKDLLWLPEAARWSGDETREMNLIRCTNDGQRAEVTFEGEFVSGLPGITIRKTYAIPADSPTIEVEVTLRNELVDETPQGLSYWSHNVLNVGSAQFVGNDGVIGNGGNGTMILPARGISDQDRKHVLMPDKIAGETDGVYAEYFPASGGGLVFRLPENFLNVYRWSSGHDGRSGSEWMSRPLHIAAGNSETLRFSITAVPDATPATLQAMLAQATAAAPAADAAGADEPGVENLLEVEMLTFAQPGPDDVPLGYRFWRSESESEEGAEIRWEQDEEGVPVVTLAIHDEGGANLDLEAPLPLEPEQDYVFMVDMKVEDLYHTGSWYDRPAGIRLYVYGAGNVHTWLAVWGQGGTDGWVTCILPFSTREHEEFQQVRFYLRCANMIGTVKFRNPVLAPVPEGMELQRSFEMEDGSSVFNSALQLP